MKTDYKQFLQSAILSTCAVFALSADARDDKEFFKKDDCLKNSCPIAKPICPPFDPDNGFIVTSLANDSDNTLRAAIEAANASNAGPCNPFVIIFNVPPTPPETISYISITQPLPTIKKSVCIDGFSNEGASEQKRILNVGLCGSFGTRDGLVLGPTACGSTIKGLIFVSFVQGSAILVRADNSLIAGNNIGDVSDDSALCSMGGNANSIGITVENAQHVTIGGLCPYERNVVSGNKQDGIRIQSNKVTVIGNYIGTDVSGLFARGNVFNGIVVNGDNNIIGCKQQHSGNLVSGNGIDPTDENNGITISGSHNRLANNIIGLDVCGKRSLGAQPIGLKIDGTSNTVLKSVISGNTNTNIKIAGSFNTVKCSLVGTDPLGRTSFKSDVGILIEGSSTTTSGTNDTGTKTSQNLIEKNLISVAGGIGISVENASSTVITRNRIGSDCKENCSLGQATGIKLESVKCADTLSRSPRPRSRSDVRPRLEHRLQQRGQRSQQRFIRDPQKRTTVRSRAVPPTGTCPRPCGECSLDLLPLGCCPTLPLPTQTVSTCIKDNLILGNTCFGILLESSTRFTTIEKNLIGVTKKCCFVPNGYGVFIKQGSQNNLVNENLIAGNRYNGVAVDGFIFLPEIEEFGQTFNNSITKNGIFANCGSGIRLNALGNNCLSAPLITSALSCEGKVEVIIDAESLPDAPFTIELYGNTQCRKCISEGELFLCCATFKESTSEEIKIVAPLPCPELKFISATVTELTACFATGNTSEFSCPVLIEKCVQEPIREVAAELLKPAQDVVPGELREQIASEAPVQPSRRLATIGSCPGVDIFDS